MQRIQSEFEILGIEPTSDREIIKNAYRKKVLETHPDRLGGDKEKFNNIVKAYELIIKNHDNKIKRIRFEEIKRKKERRSNMKAIGLFSGISVSLLLAISIFFH